MDPRAARGRRGPHRARRPSRRRRTRGRRRPPGRGDQARRHVRVGAGRPSRPRTGSSTTSRSWAPSPPGCTAHARTWPRPAGFTRFRWDYDTSIGDRRALGPLAGRHGHGPGGARRSWAGWRRRCGERLALFGTGPDRFGLIHADMRLANLLVDGARRGGHRLRRLRLRLVHVRPRLLAVVHRARPPSPRDDRLLGARLPHRDASCPPPRRPSCRRSCCSGGCCWSPGSARTRDTDLAQEMGEEFTRVSCALAEDYLTRFATTRERSSMFTSIAGRSVVVTGGYPRHRQGHRPRLRARRRQRARSPAATTTRPGGGRRSWTPWATARSATSSATCRAAEACALMAATAVERHGGIDVLCANAGHLPRRQADRHDRGRTWTASTTPTSRAPCSAVQACVPALAASGHGRVILTSSITGPITGYPGLGALRRQQGRPARVHAHRRHRAGADGYHRERRAAGQRRDGGTRRAGRGVPRRRWRRPIPAGRLGEVDEIGYAALFFATDEAAYVTGQALAVDGGQVLPESLAALQAAQA